MPFEARPLPTAIFFDGDGEPGEIVAGPFCRHCGYPLSLHSDELLCPAVANSIMGPCCDCHEVREVEVTRMLPNPNSVRRRKDGSPVRMKVTRMERCIVRTS